MLVAGIRDGNTYRRTITMNARNHRRTCGDSGGVDSHGRPCGSPPVRREQDIAGRCRHHGDADGEANRQERARSYARQETEKEARMAFNAALEAYANAEARVAKAALAARPAINDLAVAKEELEKARQTCEELGVWTVGVGFVAKRIVRSVGAGA